MARIKIELPERFLFSTSLRIRVYDLNYGGHLGNDRILTLAHEARMHFFNALGYENELNIAGNRGTVITDAAVVFRSESFYGDHIGIKIALDGFNKYGFDMFYYFEHMESKKEIARAKTGIVFMDYDLRKVTPVPEQFLEKIENYGKTP